jgi:hypothetical protein
LAGGASFLFPKNGAGGTGTPHLLLVLLFLEIAEHLGDHPHHRG